MPNSLMVKLLEIELRCCGVHPSYCNSLVEVLIYRTPSELTPRKVLVGSRYVGGIASPIFSSDFGGFFEMSNSTDRFKLSIASLKGALCMHRPSDEPLSNSLLEEDFPMRTIPDEDEEKLRERPMLSESSLQWVYLFLAGPNVEEDEEEFVSTESVLTSSSISRSRDDFLSAKITFTSCPSPDRIELDFLDSRSMRRLSMIQELCHCKGWPFGLCRKLVLFPPWPKSPTDSWSWCKAKIT